MRNDIPESEIEAARGDMAAMFRLAARFELHEGIDNHCSYACGDGTFLVNRWAVHWSRMKRSDILRVDGDGNVLQGEGTVERTAFYIHESFHRIYPNAVAVLHTHMPYATAIACTEPGRIEPISQNALRFYGQIAYDDDYAGLANDRAEGDRLARSAEGKPIVMLKNHGIMVSGPSIGIAFNDLYFLERSAMVQVLAQSTRDRLVKVPHETAALTASQVAELDEDKETHFQVLKAMLAEDEPEYMN